jgi:hypothetical protein
MEDAAQQPSVEASLADAWGRTSERRHASGTQWATTFAVLAAAVYLNTLAQVVLDELAPALLPAGSAAAAPLPDVGFALLPAVRYHAFVNLTSPLLSGALVLLLWFYSGRLFNGFLRHVLNIQAVVFLLRAAALSATLLPPPLAECASAPPWTRSWPLLLRPLLVIAGRYMTCYDSFFSGHAANLTIAWLAIQRWIAPGRHWGHAARAHEVQLAAWLPRGAVRAGHTLVFIYYVGALLLIIMSRFHYTLDVLAGVAVAATTFAGYFVWLHLAPPHRVPG